MKTKKITYNTTGTYYDYKCIKTGVFHGLDNGFYWNYKINYFYKDIPKGFGLTYNHENI